ncbi:MAG: hypothetical protein LIP00_05355 [Parabacteroides sp.]|nr:hypothetical protein [Parabacteroides sp.]
MKPVLLCLSVAFAAATFSGYAQYPEEAQSGSRFAAQPFSAQPPANDFQLTFTHFRQPSAPENLPFHYPDTVPSYRFGTGVLPGTATFFNVPPPVLYRAVLNRNPFYSGTRITRQSRLSSNLFFLALNRQNNYPGLGGYETLGGGINWQPGESFSVTGGILVSKLSSPRTISPTDQTGFTFSTRYAPTGKLDFTLWGRVTYTSPVNRTDPFIQGNPLYPGTGGGFEINYKPAPGIRIKTGIHYLQNRFTPGFGKNTYFRQRIFYGF